MNKKSFQNQIVYQIYPKSFLDTDGNGVGDLKGIIKKLPYLKKLGVTTLWLSPIFKSPMEDNGYDVSDYYHVDPTFGTDEDLFTLIEKAKEMGIHIVLDLVVNHTSKEHAWFKEAIKSKDNPYHDYYVFRDHPNGLMSTFGGTAWEYNEPTNEYYLHLFAVGQPDLNWQNPKVHEEIYKMMNYWLEHGVYGFRMDVIENLGKEPDKEIVVNGPTLHPILQEMARETFDRFDSITIGETWSSNEVTRLLYTDPKRKELNMVFLFNDFMQFCTEKYGKWVRKPFSAKLLREALFKRQLTDPKKTWDAIFWNNHDLPRALNRYTDLAYRKEAAKFLFTITLFFRGTPFIYQGDELGMKNPIFKDENDYRDIEEINALRDLQDKGLTKEEALQAIQNTGRDNARIPFQWNNKKNHGFSKVTPWLDVDTENDTFTVENEMKDPTSVLRYYKKAIRLWKSKKYRALLKNGSFTPLDEDSEYLFHYLRQYRGRTIEVIGNFSNQEQWSPKVDGEALLHNYEDQKENALRPYEVYVVLHKENPETK